MIYISSDHDVGDVQNWLDFNTIAYENHQLWDQTDRLYLLPCDIENSILVCNINVLNEATIDSMVAQSQSNAIKKFCEKNNCIWFIGVDLAINAMEQRMRDYIKMIDSMIPKSSITLFLDADPTNLCYLQQLRNITIKVLHTTVFNRGLLRTQGAVTTKTTARYDFLLTMIRKPGRPHRDILWSELNTRNGLIDRGLSCYHSSKTESSWIGQTSHQHTWQDGHASMDLYNNCWLEIVPETCYQDLYFFTEKTQKPMMTCTPFLMVSTAGYLSWLRKQGFRTFNSLINEEYDQYHCVEHRVRRVVDVLEHIVNNGTEEFYCASRPILDHNFSRLSEIAGAWWYRFDRVMWQALEEFHT